MDGDTMLERIADVGYINSERRHALISIYDPALLNPGKDSVQVAISLEGATALRDRLDEFLSRHIGGLQ
jgi:hypothetical protein